MSATRRTVSRFLALVLGLSLAGVGVSSGSTASAADGFAFSRIAGGDRFETSTLVAQEYGASSSVILADGEADSFVDALSANYLAGVEDAPVLLTRHDTTPDPVLAELATLSPETVWIVGGTGAISATQEQALQAAGYATRRVAGDSRYATNAAVITTAGTAPSTTGIVATGQVFPDALGAGPLAYTGMPLALASHDSISPAVLAALQDAGVTSVLIAGGEGAIGPAVVTALEAAGISVAHRFAGDDRADTSTQIAQWAIDHLGFTDAAVNIGSGYAAGSGADALAGGALTGKQARPLLVTADADRPGPAILTYLTDHADTLTEGIIFGGTSALTAATEAAMTDAATTSTTGDDSTGGGTGGTGGGGAGTGGTGGGGGGTPPVPDTLAPTVDIASIANGTGGTSDPAVVDAGDEVVLQFSEPVTLTPDASFTFYDAWYDGSGTVTRGVDADMELPGTGDSVVLTLTGDPVLGPDHPGPGLDWHPVFETIAGSDGVADLAGNDLAEVTADIFEPGIGTSATTVTFNAPMDTASLDASEITGTVAPTTLTWASGDRVVNLLYDAPFTANDTFTLAGNSVLNVYGGNGPAQPVTVSTRPSISHPYITSVVRDTAYTISGQARDGWTVTVYDDGDPSDPSDDTPLGSGTSGGPLGAFSIPVTLTADAVNELYIVASDGAGHSSSQILVPLITHDSSAPAMVSFTTATDAITVSYDEAVQCAGVDASRFLFSPTGDPGRSATADTVTCTGSTATLTFDSAAGITAASAGSLRYIHDLATGAPHIQDTAGHDAVSPDTVFLPAT